MSSRFGFIAVIGPPNAGKSTLANALIGQKVSIAHIKKAQTTRARCEALLLKMMRKLCLLTRQSV